MLPTLTSHCLSPIAGLLNCGPTSSFIDNLADAVDRLSSQRNQLKPPLKSLPYLPTSFAGENDYDTNPWKATASFRAFGPCMTRLACCLQGSFRTQHATPTLASLPQISNGLTHKATSAVRHPPNQQWTHPLAL
jgi:hypothetical protein